MSVSSDKLPPVPSQSPVADPARPSYFGATWSQWFTQVKAKVDIINASLVGVSSISGTGLIIRTGTGWVTRNIQGTTGEIEVINGDGVGGNPTAQLANTAVTPGSYTNTNLTVDAFGRITAASNGSSSGGGTFISLTDVPSSYVGQAGKYPKVNAAETGLEFAAGGGGGGGIASGTTFPSSPAANDLFFRTDLGFLCFWDNTNSFWLTVQEYQVSGIPANGTSNIFPIASGSGATLRWPIRQDFSLFISAIRGETYTAPPISASQYWDWSFEMRDAANNILGNLVEFTTTADTANNWSNHDIVVATQLNTNTKELRLNAVKVGSVGLGYAIFSLCFRLIVT